MTNKPLSDRRFVNNFNLKNAIEEYCALQETVLSSNQFLTFNIRYGRIPNEWNDKPIHLKFVLVFLVVQMLVKQHLLVIFNMVHKQVLHIQILQQQLVRIFSFFIWINYMKINMLLLFNYLIYLEWNVMNHVVIIIFVVVMVHF